MPSRYFFKQWHISRTIITERSPLHNLFSGVTGTNIACICNSIWGKYIVFVFVVFLANTIFHQCAFKNKTDEGRKALSKCWWLDDKVDMVFCASLHQQVLTKPNLVWAGSITLFWVPSVPGCHLLRQMGSQRGSQKLLLLCKVWRSILLGTYWKSFR